MRIRRAGLDLWDGMLPMRALQSSQMAPCVGTGAFAASARLSKSSQWFTQAGSSKKSSKHKAEQEVLRPRLPAQDDHPALVEARNCERGRVTQCPVH